MCEYVSVGVCVISLQVPKEPVGGGAPVGDVIEEDLQLIIIVKVCNDNGAHRRRHCKFLGCYVLSKKTKEWHRS